MVGRPQKLKLKKSAATDISKAALTQVVVLFVPLIFFDTGILVVLFFTNWPLVYLVSGSVSGLSVYMTLIVAIYYRAKGRLADKFNFGPVTFIWPDLTVTNAWTYAEHNPAHVDEVATRGMMVGGRYVDKLVSTWHANKTVWPESIEIPKSKGQRFRKLYLWTPALHQEVYIQQPIQTISGALPVGASGVPLAVILITDIVSDPELEGLGEPVAIGILRYSTYYAKLDLQKLGKLMPTAETLATITTSVANKQMLSLQQENAGLREQLESMGDTIRQEREGTMEVVGEALKAQETLLGRRHRRIPVKWLIVASISVIAAATLITLFYLGVI